MARQRIYMDYAATTPVDPAVVESMMPWMQHEFGNASTLYEAGRRARQAIDESRDTVAAAIGAGSTREIVFTSGGSEANNAAMKGAALALQHRGRHVVVSAIEHQAMLNAARWLGKIGFSVTEVLPDADGIVHPEAVAEAMTDETTVVAVMHANNEIGTVQPVASIAPVVKERGAVFIVDAVQTVGHIPVDVDAIGCDMLTLSGHKLYGPKGVGALYVRRETPFEPLIHGGSQEQERRAGTESPALIVGLAESVRRAVAEKDAVAARLAPLRDRLGMQLLHTVPGCIWVGANAPRLPGHVNMLFPGVEGESVLLNLDMHGIEASSGSACTAGSIEASHVLLALGFSREQALGSVRLTLGRDNDEADVDRVIDVLARIVSRLTKAHGSSGYKSLIG